MSSSPSNQRTVIILSGGTGRTASQLLTAALAQFSDPDIEVRQFTKVRSIARAIEVVREAASSGAIVLHSLVNPKVRRAVEAELRALAVPCVDVLGPSLMLLGDYLGQVPRGKAGLLYEVHREQLDRMDAMDFMLAHDDGKRATELGKADVVLVGASRTTKSVTCVYLASRGVRAANVPLIPGQPPPPELTKLNPTKVIGLTMSASHLEFVRQHRLDRIVGGKLPHYADLRDIQAELREVRELMSKHHWEYIDVSYKATEEVADCVLEMLPQSHGRRVLSASSRAR
jgi:[pyruvate, water dikinase]-phosphate phosphotransferase / [pyruvate, water dikinase] kinase